MNNPDEEIILRRADWEHERARAVQTAEERDHLARKVKALQLLLDEARLAAEEYRNEYVHGDRDQCGRDEEPLPWEPERELSLDERAAVEADRIATKGCQDYHFMVETDQL